MHTQHVLLEVALSLGLVAAVVAGKSTLGATIEVLVARQVAPFLVDFATLDANMAMFAFLGTAWT